MIIQYTFKEYFLVIYNIRSNKHIELYKFNYITI